MATRRPHIGRPSAPLTDPEAIGRRAYQNRANDKRRGFAVFMPIRYADDFIVLDSSRDDDRKVADEEKVAIGCALEPSLGLTLSEEKTLVTPVTSTMRFLGHHIRVRKHPRDGHLAPRAVIPKERSKRQRLSIKAIFRRRTCTETLENRLRLLNPILRRWANFYRHAWGAKRVFTGIDHYAWWTIHRWLRKRHPETSMGTIGKRYAWRKPRGRMLRWCDGTTKLVSISPTRVRPYSLGWQKTPPFASTPMESPVRIERRTPGAARGVRKPRGETPA